MILHDHCLFADRQRLPPHRPALLHNLPDNLSQVPRGDAGRLRLRVGHHLPGTVRRRRDRRVRARRPVGAGVAAQRPERPRVRRRPARAPAGKRSGGRGSGRGDEGGGLREDRGGRGRLRGGAAAGLERRLRRAADRHVQCELVGVPPHR